MASPSSTASTQAQQPALAGLAPLLRPVEDVFALVRDARVCLFGEASHGTQEFYELRCDVSKRLIQEAGCMAVCIEGDFPETSSLHRYVMGYSASDDVDDALLPFQHRFPVWMWRNEPVREFLLWLRAHNASLPCEKRCGIFGLDLYSLGFAMECVVGYLKRRDPAAAEAVRLRYACFDPFLREPQLYGAAVARHLHAGCRDAVLSARSRVVEAVKRQARPTNHIDTKDEDFFAEMNAGVVVDAEKYYRAMFEYDDSSWNVRDRHFDATLYRVRHHLRSTRGGESADKVVVWAHNSHLGNAGATARAARGETNLGQLVRQIAGSSVVSVGQFTHGGTVTAAPDWGEPHEAFSINPSLPGSIEAALHALSKGVGRETFALDLRQPEVRAELTQAAGSRGWLERAIGVVYKPMSERASHYFSVAADLSRQFDIAVWCDTTSDLSPLDAPARPRTPDLEQEPEMGEFPSGVLRRRESIHSVVAELAE